MRVPTLVLLVVSGVVLLACATPEGRSSDVATIPKKSVSPRLDSQSSSASVAPAPRPKPALFVVNPEILVGLNEQRMVELLGWPGTIRDEPPAMVWSYPAGNCSLDVFFYRNVANNVSRSLAYTVTTADKTEEAKRACLVKVDSKYRDTKS